MSSSLTLKESKTNEPKEDDVECKIGSKVDVYSKSAKKWLPGDIIKIIYDSEGPWLEVKYSFKHKFRSKQMKPNAPHIRAHQPANYVPNGHQPQIAIRIPQSPTHHDNDNWNDDPPNDIPWMPSNKMPLSLDSNIRNKWTIGSQVEVYSVISKQWINGHVKRIIIDDEGEWLEIEYMIQNETRMKQVERHAKNNIRPVAIIQRLEQSIPNKIHTQNAKYTAKDNIIVTNTNYEYHVPDIDHEISTMVTHNNDWKSTLYDIYTYCNTESKINKHYGYDMHFKNKEITAQFESYLRKRLKKNHTVDTEPKSKIVDSILAYHHYTIAVSHIIKNYHIFTKFKLSVIFIINRRYSMTHDAQRIQIKQILNQFKIDYLKETLIGNDLNKTIKSIWNVLNEYIQNKMETKNKQIVLLLKLTEDTHESNQCTLYIYNQDKLRALDAKTSVFPKKSLHYTYNNPSFSKIVSKRNKFLRGDHVQFTQNSKTHTKSTLIPYIPDDHWSLFILQFEYINKSYVKCYWKIDGKILRFFPKHMESVWPKYFVMTPQDTNKLIYHHKYRHQFGVGLYDKAFCTLYYAVTKRRFLSTHYYREYHVENSLSLKNLKIDVNEKGLEIGCKRFKKFMVHKCKIDENKKTRECNVIRRVMFMLKKHSDNKLDELCYILKKSEINHVNYIEDDIDHLINCHSHDFKEKLTKLHKRKECAPKLACWPLRRRTRSIFRVNNSDTDKHLKLNVYDVSETLGDEEKEFEVNPEDNLQIKTIRRILDNLHCEIFHRDSDKNFRQMWVNKNGMRKLTTSTLADFENVILNNAIPLWSLYVDLSDSGISEDDLKAFQQYMAENEYDMDNIRIIEDIQNDNENNIYEYLKKSSNLNSQKYENIVQCHFNDRYLRTAAIFRKYVITEEIFINADKKDIKDLLLSKGMNIDKNTFDAIYREIQDQLLQIEDEKEQNDLQNAMQYPIYKADSIDEWLSTDHSPKFKNMKDELLQNSFSPISRSDYIDTEIECQLLHENKERNVDIMSREELIALKVFTDYSHLQTAFSMAFYDNKSKDKSRKSGFYRWSLILQQAMHYSAKNSDDDIKLWRGLKGLLHFDSFEPMAKQPTSFSLNQHKASEFCGDCGILLESSKMIGIALKWLSKFEHEDEWWCFNVPLKLDRIYIKSSDVGEKVKYLKYSLQNMPDPVPNGDINTFDFYDDVIKQYVIDLLDFEQKEPEILKPTKYKKLTLLQRLFFELKQYFIIHQIWNYGKNDIESCTIFQRLYLLEHHIFSENTMMDKECKSYKYRQKIIGFIKKKQNVSISSELCEDIVRYISERDCSSFVKIVNECIDKYNTTTSIKINEKQQKNIIEYFKSNGWNHDTFNESNRSVIVNTVFQKEGGLSVKQSTNLYKYIKEITQQQNIELNVDDFDDFYFEIIKYKMIKKCNPLQLKYILETHILRQMDDNSDAITYHKAIAEYIESKNLNGEAFIPKDEDTFSENIAKFIFESDPSLRDKLQNTNNAQNNDGNKNANKAFIKILKRSIAEHQAKYWAKKKKPLYLLDKKHIVEHFKSADYSCDDFTTTNKADFTKQILLNKLKIKMVSAKKLYEIMAKQIGEGEPMMDNDAPNSTLNFNDLYQAIQKWESNKIKDRQSHTFIDYKLGNTKQNAFGLLIGNIDLVLNVEEACFQIKLNKKQQYLLSEYPPTFKLILITKKKEKIIKSSTSSFRIDIVSIAVEPTDIDYRVSFGYEEYELLSRLRTISISAEDIDACRSVYDISGSATPIKSVSPEYNDVFKMPTPMTKGMFNRRKKKVRFGQK